MIQVRTVFQVKFGKIDQAVDLFRRLPNIAGGPMLSVHYHLLSDLSGPMFTLVQELVVSTLGDWETAQQQLFSRPDFDEWFKGFQQFIEGGRTEYYTIEGECEEWTRPGVIVVREAFRALKWQIRPAVGLLQRYGALMVDSSVGRKPRITTDLSGPMFQVAIEVETAGLSEWESSRRLLFRRPEFQLWFMQLAAAVEAGAHEFYRVEA